MRVSFVESLPARPSVGAVLASGNGPRLVLNGHLDTVPVGDARAWTSDPFDLVARDGRAFGLGACDMKAGLAVALDTARWLSERRRRRFRGRLRDHARADRLSIASASRGLVTVEVAVNGRSGHASEPERAANPLTALPDVLLAGDRLRAELRPHPILGGGSLTPTIVRGGETINVVPSEARIVFDRRLVPGETTTAATREIDAALELARERHPELAFEVRPMTPGFEPVEVDPEIPFARALASVIEEVTGEPATVGPAPYACDVSRLVAAGIPAVAFGPGDIADCHRPNENVTLADLDRAARAMRSFVARMLLARSLTGEQSTDTLI